MDIKNKIIVVTGASSGIGRAIAERVASQGARVILVARDKEKLESLAKNIREAHVIQADLSVTEEVEKMVRGAHKVFGHIDVLINNAGQGYDALIEEIEKEKFEYIFHLNLLAPVLAMREVIPMMREAGGGMIINISSGTSLRNLPGMSPYAGLKSALNNISLTARKELAKDNIKVGVVYPYITATEFEKHTLRPQGIAAPEELVMSPGLPPADTPEFVADLIMKAIQTEAAETFAHEFMIQKGSD